MIRRCKSRFNSVKERWCAAGGRAFCSSRNFIGNRNPTGWYGVAVESFNNVISPKDLEFLWRIGNKLMQLSLCSAMVGLGRMKGWRKFFASFFALFFHDTAETIFCLRRLARIFIFALARCLIFYTVFNFMINNFYLSNKMEIKKKKIFFIYILSHFYKYIIEYFFNKM